MYNICKLDYKDYVVLLCCKIVTLEFVTDNNAMIWLPLYVEYMSAMLLTLIKYDRYVFPNAPVPVLWDQGLDKCFCLFKCSRKAICAILGQMLTLFVVIGQLQYMWIVY